MTVTPIPSEPIAGIQPIDFAHLNFDQLSVIALLLAKTCEYFGINLQPAE